MRECCQFRGYLEISTHTLPWAVHCLKKKKKKITCYNPFLPSWKNPDFLQQPPSSSSHPTQFRRLLSLSEAVLASSQLASWHFGATTSCLTFGTAPPPPLSNECHYMNTPHSRNIKRKMEIKQKLGAIVKKVVIGLLF